MVETVLSVMLVGGLFLAALNTAGAAAATRRDAVSRAEGMLLAQDLMAEIVQQHYEEPSAGVTLLGISLTGLLGIDVGESAGDSTRNAFDDVDDYDAWSAAPQTKQGAPIAWAGRYRVAVRVVAVELDQLERTSGVETGVKRIIVTVTRGGRVVAELTAYRSKSWGGRVDN
jgi:hypothetical protein